jgi:hypothetical protein
MQRPDADVSAVLGHYDLAFVFHVDKATFLPAGDLVAKGAAFGHLSAAIGENLAPDDSQFTVFHVICATDLPPTIGPD